MLLRLWNGKGVDPDPAFKMLVEKLRRRGGLLQSTYVGRGRRNAHTIWVCALSVDHSSLLNRIESNRDKSSYLAERGDVLSLRGDSRCMW